MADLNETATQFANDLIAQNIAGLMMVFTPNGMGKAMAMQGDMQAGGAQPTATGFELRPAGEAGDDRLIDLVLKNATGEVVISVTWREIAGEWKVEDIGVKA